MPWSDKVFSRGKKAEEATHSIKCWYVTLRGSTEQPCVFASMAFGEREGETLHVR